jgi:hypothetical protein
MIDPTDDALVIRGPADTGVPIFRGPFTDACKFVWGMPPDERAGVSVLEGDVVYDAAQLESMRGEDEGEI